MGKGKKAQGGFVARYKTLIGLTVDLTPYRGGGYSLLGTRRGGIWLKRSSKCKLVGLVLMRNA